MNPRSYAIPRPAPGAPTAAGRGPARRSLPRRLAALAVALGALLGLLLGTAAPASAHAALIGTDPAQNSVVKTAPQRVELTYSEGVLLSSDSLRVLDPRGTNVAVGAPGHATGKDAGATATIALRTGLSQGTYTVAWRAISQDSHPVAGAFTFSVGAPSKTTVDLSDQAAVGGGAAGTLYGIGRFLAYAGFALLVGGSVFLSVCWPKGALLRPMRRIATTGWVTMVVATIALIMLRGPYVNGKGLGQAFDVEVMRAQLETRPGAALISRLLLLAAAAVFLAVLFGSYAKREDPAERADLAWGLGIGGGVVAVGIAATWAMAEHASVGIQRKVAMPVDVVHLLSMAVWLGGLITLLTALWAPSMAGAVDRSAIRRFSTLALSAVTALIASGTYQAWRQMGSWRAFTDTSYGRLLLIKICLVCVLVGVAWFSRRWTREIGQRGAAGMATASVPAARVKSAPVKAEEAAGVASGVAEPVGAGAGSGGPETGGGGGSAGAGGAERAVQLRRQQAARSAAQARKVRDADPARGALRRSVLAEVVVAAALLTVTTLLTGAQPGRAAEEQKGLAAAPTAPAAGAGAPSAGTGVPTQIALDIPYDTGGPNGKGTAGFAMSPARAGTPNEIHLLLTDPGNKPVDVPEVRVAFTLPAQHLGPIQVPLHRLDNGHWTASGVQLPLPGDWQLSVTVRTSDIDEVTVTKNVRVGS
ncbi:copper resistance protein CopC [Streptomyces sp. NBC_01190]|uniref:copper resistance CopC/CopD family protein n=1 Tax=Streptomyces sp. NBC_01190 TaxID=2903767 RepID=UPI003867ACEF|nr:copper resistance protein CopC [Streptomyces sp. NBC_01190]